MHCLRITFKFISDKHALYFKVSGYVVASDFSEAIENAFDLHNAENCIWDLSDADLSDIDYYKLQEIIESSKAINKRRPEGARTALIAHRPDGKALLQLYKALNLHAPSHIRYRVFSDYQEAAEWVVNR